MYKYFALSVFFPFWIAFCQENTNPYDSLCPCDLTANSCDVNCCCDQYCSLEDRSIFTECSNQIQEFDTKTCFPPATIIFNSTDYTTQYENGLLCIYYDNYRQRNYYIQPLLADSVQLFEEYRTTYGTEAFETKGMIGENPEIDTAYYKYGDPMYTVGTDNLLSHFILPQPVLTDYCNYNTPAGFLKPADVTCSHSTRDLARECGSAWHMNGRYFQNFQLLRSPEPIAAATGHRADTGNATSRPRPASSGLVVEPNDKIVIISSVAELIHTFESIAETVHHVGGDDAEASNETSTAETATTPPITTPGPPRAAPPPAPAWDGGNRMCRNVPLKVSYVIVLGEGGRIAGAASDVTYGSVSAQSTAFQRRFSISFRWVNDTQDSFRRSGNPGYVIGLPVMAGEIMQQNNTETILLAKENTQWLTLMTPTAQGSCISQNRTPVLFGENIQTGCLIEISSNTNAEACRRLRADVLYGLRGPLRNRIAVYGNVSVERTADWIPILVENEPQPDAPNAPGAPRGTCQNMILGLHYEILYAYTGSSSKPQAKIIGAKMKFLPSRSVSVQCIGPYCSASLAGLSQKIPVVSSVTFIDISNKPEAILAEVPTLNARLPYDFFYPFSGVSAASRTEPMLLYAVGFLLCLLLRKSFVPL